MQSVKSTHTELAEFQEIFAVIAQELDEAYSKTHDLLRKFKQAELGTEAYDNTWAELYVGLNVVEAKAHTVQEILDKINDLQDDKE